MSTTPDRITIRRIDGTPIFTASEAARTTRDAVQEAVRVRANLHGANLRWADLRGADLHGAYLYDANLYEADLHGADLREADLHGADLYRVNSLIDAGQDSRGYHWVAVCHDDGPRIAAGCRWFTLAEAHEHWDGEHYNGPTVAAECRARLAMIEAIATARGWAMPNA